MVFVENVAAAGAVAAIREEMVNMQGNPWAVAVPPPQMIRVPRPAPQNRAARPQF